MMSRVLNYKADGRMEDKGVAECSMYLLLVMYRYMHIHSIFLYILMSII